MSFCQRCDWPHQRMVSLESAIILPFFILLSRDDKTEYDVIRDIEGAPLGFIEELFKKLLSCACDKSLFVVFVSGSIDSWSDPEKNKHIIHLHAILYKIILYKLVLIWNRIG